MKIAILDFGNIAKDSNAISTIHSTIELAQYAEKVGVYRYWLAEHHEEGLAWRNPEIVINLIAGFTSVIKVGAAGVLLPLYSPLVIAQNYKLLENLYPGRIDLGLAKGLPSTFEKRLELSNNSNLEKDFSEHYFRVIKVKDFLSDKDPNFMTTPCGGSLPEIWMLSSSNSHQEFILNNDLNVSFSLFHIGNRKLDLSAFKKAKRAGIYKGNYNVAISAFCSEDSERVKFVKSDTKNVEINVCGNGTEVQHQILQIAYQYELNEIVILNLGRTFHEKQYLLKVIEKICTDQ